MDVNFPCKLVNFCLLFRSLLNLNDEELICMYIECLAVLLCLQDRVMFVMVPMMQILLDELCSRLHFSNNIMYYEKCLRLALLYKNKELERSMNLKLGRLHSMSGNYHQGIMHFEKALTIAKETGDKTLEGEAYMLIGQSCNELFDCEKAIKSFKQCLNLIQEIHPTRSKHHDQYLKMAAHGGLGNSHRMLGNYKEAIKLHKICLAVATELGNKSHIGRAYGNLGIVYTELSELDQALDFFQKDLNIALELNDMMEEAITYGSIGQIYCMWCQYDKAIEYQERKIRIAKQLGSKTYEASAYMDLGIISHCLDNYHKAIEYCQKALGLFKETDDKDGEGKAYRNLGRFNISLGRYEDANRHLNKALEITVKAGDNVGEHWTHLHIGDLYCNLGRFREAIDYYFKESLEFAVKIGNKNCQKFAFRSLGSAYLSIGDTMRAVACFEMQLKLAVEVGDQLDEGKAYRSLGIILLFTGKYSDAMEHLKKSLEIAIKTKDKSGEGEAHQMLGSYYRMLKNYSEADHHYQKSLTIARDTKRKHSESSANSRLGRLYFEIAISESAETTTKETNNQDNYKKSERYLREAIEGSDWVFHHIHDHDDFKISIFKEFVPTYNILTEVLIETQQMEEALLVSERGRGRALSDLLISKYYISHQEAAALESTSLKYDDVQAFLQRSKLCILFYTMAYRYVIWVLVHNKPVYCHLDKTGEFQKLREASAVWKKNKGLYQPLVYEAYVKMLVDDAYDKMNVRGGMSCEDRSLDLHNTRGHSDDGQVSTNYSDQDAGGLSNQAEQLQDLSLEESVEATNVQDTRHPLEKLFDVLVAPVQSRLTEENIVIIPQGPLYLVPFAALRDSKTGLYLSEMKCIRLAPSLAGLMTLQECPADYHSKSGALVIGNPKVGQVMFKGEKVEFQSLPSAENEAKYVSYRLGVPALTGSQATKEEVKKRLTKGVAVVHIAAHGDSRNGEIALAPSDSAKQNGRIPEEDDYLLTMKEVQEIGVRAQLVVLSCCHSGRGKIEAEGVVGMSRAFLAAGARAVIASLWGIDDYVTLSFMVSLYNNLKMGHSASKSLQQAMEDIRKENHTEPKYWAPFFLIGDDVTISV